MNPTPDTVAVIVADACNVSELCLATATQLLDDGFPRTADVLTSAAECIVAMSAALTPSAPTLLDRFAAKAMTMTPPQAGQAEQIGPDFFDGCSLEGFTGGCERMGCHPNEVARAVAWLDRNVGPDATWAEARAALASQATVTPAQAGEEEALWSNVWQYSEAHEGDLGEALIALRDYYTTPQPAQPSEQDAVVAALTNRLEQATTTIEGLNAAIWALSAPPLAGQREDAGMDAPLFDKLVRGMESFNRKDWYASDTGSICIDWDEDPQHQLSLILKPDGSVSFAAYIEGKQLTGDAMSVGFMLALREYTALTRPASDGADAKDAARYRWLRANASGGSIGLPGGWLNCDEPETEWDAEIDAALTSQQAGGKS